MKRTPEIEWKLNQINLHHREMLRARVCSRITKHQLAHHAKTLRDAVWLTKCRTDYVKLALKNRREFWKLAHTLRWSGWKGRDA